MRQFALACDRLNVYHVRMKDLTLKSRQKEGWIMRSERWIGRTVVLLAAMCLAGSCQTAPDESLKAKFERTVELDQVFSPGSQLTVSTASGAIEIVGQEADNAHVIAKIVARAPTKEDAQDLAETIVVGLEPTANGLELRVGRPAPASKRSVSVSYKIIVPRQTSIDCASLSGSIEIADLLGDVAGRTASGAIEIARVTGSLRVHSTSGPVRCEKIDGGDVSLESMSGGVHLSDASNIGTCHMGAASGSLTAKKVEAQFIQMRATSGAVTLNAAQAETIDLHSVSSRVSAKDLSCERLQAESTSGDVSVTFARKAPGNVAAGAKSGAGNISVVMPRDFAGRVDLLANSGSVHMKQPIETSQKLREGHVSGTVGQGSGSLFVRAGTGTINIR